MLKMVSLFAGVGGIDLGFEQTKKFETILANEIDEKAAITYKNNFDSKLIIDDIRNLKKKYFPKYDVLLSGFPCTSFSVAGYRKGFEDENTGDLFFETLRIIVATKPKVIFLENVKNLVGHDEGKTFRIILEALESNGYHIKYQVLNAKDYGDIPQNRERIYIVGFRNKKKYRDFEFPKPIELTKELKNVIYFNKKIDGKYYYTNNKYDFCNILVKEMKSEDTLYQWRRNYVRENKSNVSPTLTANMGTGGHNVPLIKTKNGIRKLTPRECFNLQGYPNNFILPNLADSHLYKQAGNSVVVPVITRIAEKIYKALND